MIYQIKLSGASNKAPPDQPAYSNNQQMSKRIVCLLGNHIIIWAQNIIWVLAPGSVVARSRTKGLLG